MSNYINISIRCEQLLSDILVARLAEMGYEGFEEQDGSLDAFIPEQWFVEEELKAMVDRYGLSFKKHSRKMQPVLKPLQGK